MQMQTTFACLAIFDSQSETKELTQEQRFEQLYKDYWSYVFEFEVLYKNDFTPDKHHHFVNREDFRERLKEDGMVIKVTDGY